MDAAIGREIKDVLDDLERDAPGATEGLGTLIGGAAGGAAALTALSTLGVSGLSAAGITSGLAAAGSVVGAGMVAGIGVLAAPIAILGVAGYAIANKKKKAKMIAALNVAIGKLFALQERLLQNSQRYKEELAAVKATVYGLQAKLSKVSG